MVARRTRQAYKKFKGFLVCAAMEFAARFSQLSLPFIAAPPTEIVHELTG